MSGIPQPDSRPLSPHLQIWRWHLTMAASIMHRATGVALYFGTFLIVAWIVALATGADCYPAIEGLVTAWYGKLVLYLWTVAVLYHFANGIRHMLWDGPGIGFEPGTASAVSLFNFLFAFLGAAAIFAATVWL